MYKQKAKGWDCRFPAPTWLINVAHLHEGYNIYNKNALAAKGWDLNSIFSMSINVAQAQEKTIFTTSEQWEEIYTWFSFLLRAASEATHIFLCNIIVELPNDLLFDLRILEPRHHWTDQHIMFQRVKLRPHRDTKSRNIFGFCFWIVSKQSRNNI